MRKTHAPDTVRQPLPPEKVGTQTGRFTGSSAAETSTGILSCGRTGRQWNDPCRKADSSYPTPATTGADLLMVIFMGKYRKNDISVGQKV